MDLLLVDHCLFETKKSHSEPKPKGANPMKPQVMGTTNPRDLQGRELSSCREQQRLNCQVS